MGVKTLLVAGIALVLVACARNGQLLGGLTASDGQAERTDNPGSHLSNESETKTSARKIPGSSFDGETPTQADTMDQKSAEDLYQFLLAPDFSYSTLKEAIDEKDLPTLHGILSEPKYFRAWGNAATAVGLSGKGKRSFEVLEDFVTRPIEFDQLRDISDLSKADSIAVLVGKTLAIRWLPFLVERRGTLLLRQILADETKARTYLDLWSEEEIPSGYGDWDRAAMELRAAAAEGLVLSDINSSIELVKRQYRTMNEVVAAIPSRAQAPNTTPEEATRYGRDTMFLASLAGVLAKAGYIQEHGIEAYLKNLGSMQLKSDLHMRLERLLDESSVYD